MLTFSLLILVLLVTRAASQLPLTLDLTWFQTVEGKHQHKQTRAN